MNRFTKWLGIILILGMIVSSGCSTAPKPFEYQSDNELKKGAGLFSGKEGKFTIYRRPVSSEEPATREER